MKKMFLAFFFGCFASIACAQTQPGGFPAHVIPIGKGSGIVGWGQIAPNSLGNILTSNGPNADPSFQPFSSAALDTVCLTNSAFLVRNSGTWGCSTTAGSTGIINTSLTVPLIYGGTAANAQLALLSTSSAGPSGDEITYIANLHQFANPGGSTTQPVMKFIDQGTDLSGGWDLNFYVNDSGGNQRLGIIINSAGLLNTSPTAWVANADFLAYGVGPSIATNNTTAAGNNTLHFASLPNWLNIAEGPFTINDLTTPSAIPTGTTVSSITPTTVVMNNNAAGAGVGNGDLITFTGITGRVSLVAALTSTNLGGWVPDLDNTYMLGWPTQRWADVQSVLGHFTEVDLGINTTTAGLLKIFGGTSGNLQIATQAAAGTPVWTAGTSSGTPMVTASGPLAIAAATGNGTCTTCATTTNGGALSATAPITISAAGVIAINAPYSATTLTANAVLLGNGTSNIAFATIGTGGRLLIDQGAGVNPAFTAMSGDATITSGGVISVNALHSGAFANPSATIGLTVVNGSAITAMRSDGAPALSQAIAPTWTAVHIWTLTQAVNTSTDGVVLADTTAASAGNQQFSPRLRLTGQGWKTTATAASQAVDWTIENRPVQGAANPSTSLWMSYQVNAGGYNTGLVLNNAGGAGLWVDPTGGTAGFDVGLPVSGAGWSTLRVRARAADNVGNIQMTASDASAQYGAIVFFNGEWDLYVNAAQVFMLTTTKVTIPLTTASTSKTTGSFVNSGGIGNAGAIFTDTLNVITMANAATTSAVCYNTGTGLLTYDATVGTCTVSAKRFKNHLRDLSIERASRGLDSIHAGVWIYLDESMGRGERVGLYADDVEAMDSRCAGYTDDHQLQNYDEKCVLAYMIADRHALKARIERLERR